MNATELKTKEYFETRRIPLTKISESAQMTPDFEGEEILVEVKEVKPEEKEGLHKDSTYNAIKNNLKNAAKKFSSYDVRHKKRHTVVIFSDDIITDDIYSVWTGEWSPKNRERIFRGGMVLSRSHRAQIDAVVWFKKISDREPKHVWRVSEDVDKFFVNKH